jgi:two-component system, NtrC family, response regulator HydG
MDDKTTLKTREGKAPEGDTTFCVKVLTGPDAGQEVRFDATKVRALLGTSETSDLRLTDRLVSRRHLAFDVGDALLRVTDLGSSNGTTVNGVRIVDALLAGGEIVAVGETTLMVSAARDASVPRLTSATNLGRMVGGSVAMRRLYPTCARLAASNLPVVIEGETGTGKELLAETLHELGPRASGPFVVFDCAAVAPDRVDALLFGEESRTGEVHAGVLEQAHGGTLFLDEVAELDEATQAKLLRAIERGELMRVGSSTWRKVDVRFIAASRRDLDREVELGQFRKDVYFRLSVGRIELPPLRQRTGDVALLAAYFWQRMSMGDDPLPSSFLAQLESFPWPGNVRELINTMARRIALGEAAEADSVDSLRGSRSAPPGELVERVLELGISLTEARALVVEDLERRYVERMLAKHDGNVTRAAAASGLARRYFQVLRARQREE